MQQQTQERVVDGLAGTSLTAGVSMSLADFNVILETATLTIGLIAGAFAMFFQVRRYYRGKTMNEALKETQQKLDEALADKNE